MTRKPARRFDILGGQSRSRLGKTPKRLPKIKDGWSGSPDRSSLSGGGHLVPVWPVRGPLRRPAVPEGPWSERAAPEATPDRPPGRSAGPVGRTGHLSRVSRPSARARGVGEVCCGGVTAAHAASYGQGGGGAGKQKLSLSCLLVQRRASAPRTWSLPVCHRALVGCVGFSAVMASASARG